MIITFIIVTGLVVVAYGMIHCVTTLVREGVAAKIEREAAAYERRNR